MNSPPSSRQNKKINHASMAVFEFRHISYPLLIWCCYLELTEGEFAGVFRVDELVDFVKKNAMK